jgi:outer membrane lipoprotein SlyB
MMKRPLLLAMMLCGVLSAAQAATPKEQYAADSKAANDRFASDKKICADEASSNARMQCARDAKTEHDKAMASAKERLTAAGGALPCTACGKVTSVEVGEKKGESGAVGLIAGGVAGALLGHQVGGGRGKDVATVAGAAGGAYAGKKVEEKMNSSKIWTVHVQYEDGGKGSFVFEHDPGMVAGDRVKHEGKTIVRN